MTDPPRLSVQAPPSKRRRGKLEFSVKRALARVEEVFAAPCRGDQPRIEGRGVLIHRFVLPLELCLTTNSLISLAGGSGRAPKAGAMRGSQRIASHKQKVWNMLYLQHPTIRAKPLAGRVLLRCVRFTSGTCDDGADGLKVAIDYLRVPTESVWDPVKREIKKGKRGLGFIVDDSRKFVDRVSWWEKVAPGAGFSLLEVWSG